MFITLSKLKDKSWSYTLLSLLLSFSLSYLPLGWVEVKELLIESPLDSQVEVTHDPIRTTIPETLKRIRGCESNHIYTGQDGDLSNRAPRSTASGAYRFLDGTWIWVWRDIIGEEPPTERAKYATREQQDRAAVALFADGTGAHHWNASRDCWG